MRAPARARMNQWSPELLQTWKTLATSEYLFGLMGNPPSSLCGMQSRRDGEERSLKSKSATGDHNSNADAEQAVQKVEDEVRTWKDALEDAVKERIPPTHDILAWMVEHAMSIDRRTAVGEDGKTP